MATVQITKQIKTSHGNFADLPTRTSSSHRELLVTDDTMQGHFVGSDGTMYSIPNQGSNVVLSAPSISNIPTEGLLVHYTFDSGDVSGNTVNDVSGNGNDGTLAGATYQTGYINESVNTGLLTDSYVPLAVDSTTGEFTVACWIKANTQSSINFILSGYYATSNHIGFQFYLENGILAYYPFYGSGDDPFLQYATRVDDGVWHHVSATIKAGEQVLYVDGVVVDSDNKATAHIVSNGTNLSLGNRGISYEFVGQIDSLRTYDRALSLPEITALAGES